MTGRCLRHDAVCRGESAVCYESPFLTLNLGHRLYYADRIISIGVVVAVWRLFVMRTHLSRRMWFFLTTLAVRMYSLIRSSQS